MAFGEKGGGTRDKLWVLVRITMWVEGPFPGMGKGWRGNRLGTILPLAMEAENNRCCSQEILLKGMKVMGQREVQGSGEGHHKDGRF